MPKIILKPEMAQKLAEIAKNYPSPNPIKKVTIKQGPTKAPTLTHEPVAMVLPKMTTLSDGPKGPKFEQKDVPELAKKLPESHAKVYVEYSRKLSDGNYGSVGFTVGLQMPVGTAYHEIDEGFETACQFVDDKLSGLLNAATKKE